jgi:hypothetical protein
MVFVKVSCWYAAAHAGPDLPGAGPDWMAAIRATEVA